MKKTVSIILTIMLIAIVSCGIAVLVMYLNNGERNFYVQYGDRKIAHNAENVELHKDEITVFYCKTILAVTPEQENVKAKDYAVTVQPNRKALPDFSFNVDGERRRFYGSDINYGAGFDVSTHDGFFTVYMPKDYTMSEYLNRIYGNSVTSTDIELSGIKLYEKDCFTLSVRYIPDNSTVTISFH